MGIIILLLPLVLIFFMMQSQRKKAAQQQQLIASLVEGDDVMTTAGVYGTLTWVGKEEAFVEIADGVEIHIAKAAIAKKVDMATTEAALESGSGAEVAALEEGAVAAMGEDPGVVADVIEPPAIEEDRAGDAGEADRPASNGTDRPASSGTDTPASNGQPAGASSASKRRRRGRG